MPVLLSKLTKKTSQKFQMGRGFLLSVPSTFEVCYLGDLHLVFLYQVVNGYTCVIVSVLLPFYYLVFNCMVLYKSCTSA